MTNDEIRMRKKGLRRDSRIFVMAARAPVGYFPAMSQALEKRVEELEKTVADLKAKLEVGPRAQPWEHSIGIFANDPDYDSAMRLGREYREQQTYEKEIAGS